MVGTVSGKNVRVNGELFSWRVFFLGFLTRKFIIAVVVQLIATVMAYYAIDLIVETALNAKAQADQVVKVFEIWAYFTASNAAAFGLFNNASKLAQSKLQRAKALLGSSDEPMRR